MAASTITIELSLLLSFLLSVSLLGVRSDTHQNAGTIPPTCKHIECPTYDVIQVGNGYEIRRYSNSTMWMSNSPIQDISLVEATRTGFRSFFVPKENQAHPPAKGLHAQRWESVYIAARQLGGYVTDSNVGVEAAALQASIAGTDWSAAIDKSHRLGHASVYSVAQYNDPFEYDNRVNEIWFLFDMENEQHAM